MKILGRLPALLLLVLLAFSSITSGAVLGTAGVCAAEPSEPSATILIRTESGEESLDCVKLTRERANGIDALQATGRAIRTKDFGGVLGEAVCSIDGVGNSLSTCPGSSGHWHYWLWNGSEWTESQLGPASTQVTDGAVQGWTWVKGAESTPPDNTNPEVGCIDPRVASTPTKETAITPWIYIAAFAFLLTPGIFMTLRRRNTE